MALHRALDDALHTVKLFIKVFNEDIKEQIKLRAMNKDMPQAHPYIHFAAIFFSLVLFSYFSLKCSAHFRLIDRYRIQAVWHCFSCIFVFIGGHLILLS